jgi:hypothetical protein
MMNRIRILVATAFLFSSGPALAEGWLCAGEKATGFKVVPGQDWDYGRFNVAEKYLIKRPEKRNVLFPDTTWVVTVLGENTPSFYCDREFYENRIKCTWFRDFLFDRSTLRYTLVQFGDFIEAKDTDPEAATPYIEIGKCSPL